MESNDPSSSKSITTTSLYTTPLAPFCHFTPTIKSANASTHDSLHLPHHLSTRMASINIKFEHEHQPLNDTYTTKDTSSTNTEDTSNNILTHSIRSHESDTSAHQHYNSDDSTDNSQSSTLSSHDDGYNSTSPSSISPNPTSSTSNTHEKLADINPTPSTEPTLFNTDEYARCGLSQQEYDTQSHISAESSSHDNDSNNGSYYNDSNQEYDDNMSYYSE